MSIAALLQVYDEMRRLAIAGSAVAPGDFRLKKLVAPLQKSGERTPVFARIAQAVQGVVDSTDRTAASALLELTTLVNAVLYTQGATGIPGELKPVETTDFGLTTQAGARTLKPLLEALSSTGAGRMEVVRDAFERGKFRDLRLIRPALAAIDDPYPEIRDLICEQVLPLYGKAIVAELRADLDIKGRGGHLQRLKLMHRLDPEGTRDVVQAALTDGSREMRVAAVECLGTRDDDLVYLLEQTRAKAQDVRVAALRALLAAGARSADAVAVLSKAIAGVDLRGLVDRVRACPVPEIRAHALNQAEQQLAEVLRLRDGKLQGPAVERLGQLLMALDARADPGAEALLLECFGHADALAAIRSEPSGTDLNEMVAGLMSRGPATTQMRLAAAHPTLRGAMLPPALIAARATMTAAAFYMQFSPLLKGLSDKRSSRSNDGHERGRALLAALNATANAPGWVRSPWLEHRAYREHRRGEILPDLDGRWLDAAVEAGALALACSLARPGHAAANRFLSGALAGAEDTYPVLRTMVRVRHPEAVEALIATVKAQAEATHHYYLRYRYGALIADLPASALPRIEELLPTLPDKAVDQLMEHVLALRQKPQ